MAKKRRIVVVDIDGTIAKPGDRMKYMRQDPKDLDAFYSDKFDDEPIKDNVDLVKHLAKRYTLVFCTARSERARTKTLNWFDKHAIPYSNDRLLMRGDLDERPTLVVKPDLLRMNGIKPNQVAFILEDYSDMCLKWRELGFNCFQVAEGDF